MMKKNYIHIYLLGILLLLVACTGKFREFNTDQSGITDEDLIIDDNGYGIRLGIIQQGIYFNYDYGKGKNWPFQLTQNLNADMFSGYMHDAKPLNGGSHNSDSPRTPWRCFLLDSGRQYQKISTIKKYIDMVSLLKMNYFHWHLTEGLGWRIEIKQYPRLAQIGGSVGKGEEQQGFYTQKEIQEIIEYASERNITVVPEIDMPGHAEAALSAYPELGCFGQPVEVPQHGFTQNIFCAGKEEVLHFLKNILDEVCAIFPSPYIHLGGDEAPKGNWDKCPDCQKRIAAMNLKDSHDLQLWFSAQMADYLKSKGRKAIFWGDVV